MIKCANVSTPALHALADITLQRQKFLDVFVAAAVFQLPQFAQDVFKLTRIEILLPEEIAQLAALRREPARFVAELAHVLGIELAIRPPASPA